MKQTKQTKLYSGVAVTILAVSLAANLHAQTRTWYRDNDGDGWGDASVTQTAVSQPQGYLLNGFDCNDNSFNGTSWNIAGSYLSAGAASFCSFLPDGGGNLYMSFRDGAAANKATVMKYTGNGWVAVGIPGFSAATVQYTSLAFDAANTPYIAYQDAANGNKVTVMKYNGGNWACIGNAGFSPVNAGYVTMAIAPSGVPYVAFADGSNGGKACVMKYSGAAWTVAGSALSAGQASYISLAIDASGNVYFAGNDAGAGNKAIVKKCTGTTWANVGTVICTGQAPSTSLALDKNGTLYIAYADAVNGLKATLKKFTGSTWTTVGTVASSGASGNIAVAFDAICSPYLSFSDATKSGRASLAKFNGSSWVSLGANYAVSSGGTAYTGIAVSNGGIPYLAYTEGADNNRPAVMTVSPAGNNPTTPVITSLPGNNFCDNASANLTITSGNLNDAANWQWYSGAVDGIPVGTGNSISVNTATTTTYYVRAEGNCLQTPGTATGITLNVNPMPSIALASYNPSCDNCNDGSVMLSVSGGAAPYTYNWSNNATTQNIVDLLPGSYNVTITDANNCATGAGASIAASAVAKSFATLGVYPNPSKGVFTVSLPSNLKVGEAIISDVTGKIVVQKHFEQTKFSFATDLPKGQYILRAASGSDVYTTKLSIE